MLNDELVLEAVNECDWLLSLANQKEIKVSSVGKQYSIRHTQSISFIINSAAIGIYICHLAGVLIQSNLQK